MPDQLNSGGVLRRVLVLVVAGGVLGALLGVVWEWVWEAPAGTVYQGRWFLDRDGIYQAVSATGWFTVLGVGAGLLFGAMAAWFARGREVATLVGVFLGAVLAAWLMYQVGHALGPPDPQTVAATAEDMASVPGDLRLDGAGENPWPFWFESSAFCALPGGALLGLAGVFLGSHGRRRDDADRDGADRDGAKRDDAAAPESA
ncbi:hypothetical protein [Nocardioides campestrisoli]|uniref:hypothetical protein n=1 Tax=Nocardioides campestrisoli TaxID=2736757 RepID=UPI00163DCF2A|nr:hypothetical protein [Nocardioides campestrisoli]